MLDELQLLRGSDYSVNNFISIHHPTVGEICDYGEEKYYKMVSNLCATPADYKLQLLDNFGINHEDISEFDLFCMLSKSYKLSDTDILFGDLNFNDFNIMKNQVSDEIVLYNKKNDVIINTFTYEKITMFLRTLHNFKKNIEFAGNEHTKEYLLEKERRRLKFQKDKDYKYILPSLISATVNSEHFKYDYKTVWDLPIYIFMDSVKRINKIKSYDQVMQGIYSGNIDSKKISLEKFNWMGSHSE